MQAWRRASSVGSCASCLWTPNPELAELVPSTGDRGRAHGTWLMVGGSEARPRVDPVETAVSEGVVLREVWRDKGLQRVMVEADPDVGHARRGVHLVRRLAGKVPDGDPAEVLHGHQPGHGHMSPDHGIDAATAEGDVVRIVGARLSGPYEAVPLEVLIEGPVERGRRGEGVMQDRLGAAVR